MYHAVLIDFGKATEKESGPLNDREKDLNTFQSTT